MGNIILLLNGSPTAAESSTQEVKNFAFLVYGMIMIKHSHVLYALVNATALYSKLHENVRYLWFTIFK